MHEKLLGLRENPFAAGHDPRFFHLTPGGEEALARLTHGLSGGEPFLLVTGEPGIGKTALVRHALGEHSAAAFIPQPMQDPRDLLEEICIRFEIGVPKGSSKPQVMSRLERHLAELHAGGRAPLLAMDEAQTATPELLEELRLLTNLEVEGRPLLQIVLMGLPEFEQSLGRPEMVRLRQRVATHCRLEPFSTKETKQYIHTRVRAAGGDGPALFPKETCREIHRLARGVPRAINTIAGEALLKASRESAESVAPAHVQASAADSWLRTVSDGIPPVVASSKPQGGERASTPAPTSKRSSAGTPGGEISPAAPVGGELSPMDELALGQDVPHITTPDVKDWVSRFVDPARPLQIGGQILAERAAEASRREWEEVHGPADDVDVPGPVPGTPRTPRPRARVRPRNSGRLLYAVSVMVLGGVGTFLAVRWIPRLPKSPGVASAPVKTVVPPPSQSVTTAPEPGPEAARKAPSAAERSEPVAPETPPPPKVRRGIEAGSYLNPDRAEAERAMLAETTGLPVQILEGEEDGATVYRVVIGSFGSRRRAARELDELVGRGLIEQAKIVSLPAAGASQP